MSASPMDDSPHNGDGPVRLLNVLRLREDRRADAEDILARLMAHAAEEPNCTGVVLERDPEDAEKVVLQLEFPTREALDAYFRGECQPAVAHSVIDMLASESRRMVVPAAELATGPRC